MAECLADLRRLSPPPCPIIKSGVVRDGDTSQSQGKKLPAECVEVRLQRHVGKMGLCKTARRDLDACSTERRHPGRTAIFCSSSGFLGQMAA